jgi:DNA-binding PadR family transcriptional regulator
MAVREGLLLLLAERPRHGYELKTAFEERTGGLWQINTGQVYTTLERLQRDGLVEPIEVTDDAPNGDRRRPYQLTADGHDEARDWLTADALPGAPPRDELIMKVLLAANSDIDDAHTVIDAHRHQLLGQIHEIRQRQRRQSYADDLTARLCIDAVTVRLEADLRWLDLCTDRLAAAARKPRSSNGAPAAKPTRRSNQPTRGNR